MPEQAPDGSIIITPKEFYDGVRADVTEIKDSVSMLRESLAPLPRRLDDLERNQVDQDRRINALDRRGAWLAGFAAAAGSAIGATVSRLIG